LCIEADVAHLKEAELNQQLAVNETSISIFTRSTAYLCITHLSYERRRLFVCLSVCLSLRLTVTSCYHVEASKRKITGFFIGNYGTL